VKPFFRELWFVPAFAFVAILVWYFTAYRGDFASLWISNDQRAWLYYQDREYAKAAAGFDNMSFKAAAFYRSHKFKEAAKLYQPMHDPVSRYDRGNALVMIGRYAEAVQAYQQALAKRPGFREARQNLRIAQRLLDEKQREARENELKGKPAKGKPIGLQQKEKNKPEKKPLRKKPKALVKVPAEALWLDSLHTGPKGFLRMKFAYQYRRQQEGEHDPR